MAALALQKLNGLSNPSIKDFSNTLGEILKDKNVSILSQNLMSYLDIGETEHRVLLSTCV